MHGSRLRRVALVNCMVLSAAALVFAGGPANALSDPAAPSLTLDHTIDSHPWPGSGTNANDVEGIGYVPVDNALWVADDNADTIYEIDATTGQYRSQIAGSEFVASLQVGTGARSDPTRADDLESIVYDPGADVLYVSSGNCCNNPAPQPPYHPTMYKLARQGGHFHPVSWQALPEGQDPTAAGWRPGVGMYFGRGSKIKTYNYDTNAVGSDISLSTSPILGLTFTDASTAFVTTSSSSANGTSSADSDANIRRFNISGGNWTADPAWTFPLRGTGMIDARDLAVVGDSFYVTDGYDFRSDSDPLSHAVFVYRLGGAPPTPQPPQAPVPPPRPLSPLPGGYTLDGLGGLHPYRAGSGGMPPAVHGGPYWRNWDIARGVAVAGNGENGLVLDGFGGLHGFRVGGGGDPAAVSGGPYWNGWDVARGVALLPNGDGGYIVDAFGGTHRFALGGHSLPPAIAGLPYWPGEDMARGITITSNGDGGYVVDRRGALHKFRIGRGAMPADANSAANISIVPVQGVSLLTDDSGGFTIDGFGGLHGFGVGTAGPPEGFTAAYWPGWDIARDVAQMAGA